MIKLKKILTEASPKGIAQVQLYNYIKWKSGGDADKEFQLADVARYPSFAGIHFKRLQKAAKALKNKNLIDYDGVSKVSLIGESVLTEGHRGELHALAKRVFGPKVGMVEKDTKTGGQHQVWIDITRPATMFQAQKDFERWQYSKLKKLKKMMKDSDWRPVFRRGSGDVGIYIVFVKEL